MDFTLFTTIDTHAFFNENQTPVVYLFLNNVISSNLYICSSGEQIANISAFGVHLMNRSVHMTNRFSYSPDEQLRRQIDI